MDSVLKLDTNVDTILDSSPSTSSSSSSPSLIAQSDTIRPSYSRMSSESEVNTLNTASTSSLPTPTVKFAPLPIIGPRKRRSNQPLGIAARGQLVRKKRGRPGPNGELIISPSPMWSKGELDEQRKRIEAMAARHAEFQAKENAREVSKQCDEGVEDDEPRRKAVSEDGVEDPMLLLGKIVRVAGKSLWGRMSSRPKEVRPGQGQERRRDLSPLPILVKSIPAEPVPRANAPNEPTQQPETRHQDDMTETAEAVGENDNGCSAAGSLP